MSPKEKIWSAWCGAHLEQFAATLCGLSACRSAYLPGSAQESACEHSVQYGPVDMSWGYRLHIMPEIDVYHIDRVRGLGSERRATNILCHIVSGSESIADEDEACTCARNSSHFAFRSLSCCSYISCTCRTRRWYCGRDSVSDVMLV